VFTPAGAIGAEIIDLYTRYYERATFDTEHHVARSLEKLVQSSERFRKTGRLLDVGYGEGALLGIAERRGWICGGTEVSPQALDYGRSRGWTVTKDPANDPRFREGAFDVVTMIELLEHLPEPIRFIEDGARLLRRGGLLYLTTPNAGSLNLRILGLRWSVVSPPEHLILWTVYALRQILNAAGFRVLRIRAEGFNPAEILASMRWSTSRRLSVDRVKSARALSEALSRGPVRRGAKVMVNSALSSLQIGDTLKVWAVRVG